MKLWPFRREKRSTFRNPADWMWEAFGAQKSSSGISVNEKTALQIAAVWSAVRQIAETVGSLPLNVYRRSGRAKERLDGTLQTLLHDMPNPDMTAMVARETMQAHLLTWGNAYAEIVRDGRGNPVSIWPIPPEIVTPEVREGVMWYVVRLESSMVMLRSDQMLHIPAFGYDGRIGYSPIRMARDSLGLTLAAERDGASFFRNGSRASGVLEHPEKLGDEAFARLKKDWDAMHAGSDNTGRTVILEEGMKYHQTRISPEDAQFLETRVFQIQEVARWFNMPPHKLKELSHATFTNIEHLGISYATDTIRPWLVRWEQEIKRKLIREPDVIAEHNAEGLQRGDLKTRYDSYAIARNWGWMSVNDIRSLENMNPVESGDIYLQPLNMVEAGTPPEPDPNASNLQRSAAMRVAGKEHKWLQREADSFDLAKHKAWIAEVLAVDEERAQSVLSALSSLPVPVEDNREDWCNLRMAQILEVLR